MAGLQARLARPGAPREEQDGPARAGPPEWDQRSPHHGQLGGHVEGQRLRRSGKGGGSVLRALGLERETHRSVGGGAGGSSRRAGEVEGEGWNGVSGRSPPRPLAHPIRERDARVACPPSHGRAEDAHGHQHAFSRTHEDGGPVIDAEPGHGVPGRWRGAGRRTERCRDTRTGSDPRRDQSRHESTPASPSHGLAPPGKDRGILVGRCSSAPEGMGPERSTRVAGPNVRSIARMGEKGRRAG